MSTAPKWKVVIGLALLSLALGACGGGGGGGAPVAALSLTPATATVGAGTTQTLQAKGGQTPYTYAIASGSGTIDGTGVFSAPSGAGITIVKVTDARGTTAQSTLTIRVVVFASATATVDSGSSTPQTAGGGDPPYSYSVVSGGGSIDAAGKFIAPAGPANVVLEVTDARGATAQARVTVNAALAAAAGSAATIGAGTTYAVVGSGGQGPYTYSIVSGGGSIDASGHYAAPPGSGSAVVQIRDSFGSTVQVSVTINPALSAFPASATLTAGSGESFVFQGRNGVPPYQYKHKSGGGSINAQGFYTVGNSSGTDIVQVTDGQGTVAQSPVRVLRIRLNGAVFSTVTDGTNLYAGGRFSAANPYSAPRLVIVDPTTGNPQIGCDLGTGFLDGSVTALVTSGNSIYVAGDFNHYGGTAVGKLAKIDATTCALDTTFTAGGGFGADLGESIDALAIAGSSLYVGGNLSAYRGTAIRYLMKLDAISGAPDPAFRPGGGSIAGPVSAIALSGTSLYVGGYFTQVGATTVPNLAKLDAASGALDMTFAHAAGADGPVATLAVVGSSLYVAGPFQHYAGVASTFAKVDAATGAVDAAFTQNVAAYPAVDAILGSGGALYIGLQFPSNAAPTLAKIDAVTGAADATFAGSGSFDYGVSALMLSGSSLYAGGPFTHYRGAPAYSLAKLDAATGVLDTSFTQATGGNGNVVALASAGGVLVAGGSLTTYRGQSVNNIAKFNLATNALDAAFASVGGADANVIALALNGSALYLGGIFAHYGGALAVDVAKVDAGSGLLDSNFAPAGPYPAGALLIANGSLYLGGFDAGIAGPHLLKMNLLTGQIDQTFIMGGSPIGPISALAAAGSSIYVGGQFQSYGSTPVQNLIKVDANSGVLDQSFSQASGAGGSTNYVLSLTVVGSSLYAGGYLQSYRGTPVQSLIKVDAASGALDTSFTQSSGLLGNAEALLAAGPSLWVAGNFTSYRGQPTNNLIKLNLANGNPDSAVAYSGVCDSCSVNFDSLNLIGTELYVGADAGTLYRNLPSYFVFPVDAATGLGIDP